MRTKKIMEFMKKNSMELSILVSSGSYNPNFFYLSGFDGVGVLVIKKSGIPLLMVPDAEYNIAKREIRKRGNSSIVKICNTGKSRITEIIKKSFSRALNGKVGLDFGFMSLNQFNSIKKVLGIKKCGDISKRLLQLREIKEKYEISLLKKSCSISEKIINKFIKKVKQFNTEAEAAAFLVYEVNKLGLTTSFEPIVASSKNTGKWHHKPSTSRIKKGFLLLDFGLKYNGYCSDITRTVYLGNPNKKEIELYNKVDDTQNKCIGMIVPGASFAAIQKYAEERLGKYYVHALGHGIGLEIHESPDLGHFSKSIVKEGMVLAVEPGIYFPYQFGVRIEDDVVVTKSGTKAITKKNRELLVIK